VRSSEGNEVTEALESLSTHKLVLTVSLQNLANLIKEKEFNKIKVKGYEPYLRFYQVEHSDMDVFMFFNEHPSERIETEVLLPVTGRVLFYDAFTNKTLEPLM
jgi:hypothetical protein